MKDTKKQTNATTKTLQEEYQQAIESGILNAYLSIQDYHCRNNEWRNIDNGYGIELELHNDDYDTQNDLARFLNYKYKMNIEEDGSLTASSYPMEIITQPYTQSEWLNNKKKIEQFFDLINELELWNDNQTGLHIHISKKLLGKNDIIRENNINKLILILENYKEQFLKFSRRNKNELYYCNFMSNYNNNTREKYYKDLYTIQQKKYYSHNTCINRDAKTYELRIFKATTNFKEFIATLQLTFNLIEIVKRDDISELTFNDIIKLNNYKELQAYCKENKISNNKKIIDKTKTKEILQLRENSKALRENYKYNKYISRVRELIINNIDLYNVSKEEYNENSELYNNLSYIFTQTYKNNNSIYYQVKEINNILSCYCTKRIFDYKTGVSQDKRVFNKSYKNDYSKKLNQLEKLIQEKGGEI